nr:MAG TPA: hypothetical protein [Caudoviricetes sp.]
MPLCGGLIAHSGGLFDIERATAAAQLLVASAARVMRTSSTMRMCTFRASHCVSGHQAECCYQ